MSEQFVCCSDQGIIFVSGVNFDQKRPQRYSLGYLENYFEIMIIIVILMIDEFAITHRRWIKTIFTVWKAFGSYKLSSVTKGIHFKQLFCFLSNINIKCQEQLRQ